MSETGIDAYRTASVLGYCLLPMVGLGGIGMGVGIEQVSLLRFPVNACAYPPRVSLVTR